MRWPTRRRCHEYADDTTPTSFTSMASMANRKNVRASTSGRYWTMASKIGNCTLPPTSIGWRSSAMIPTTVKRVLATRSTERRLATLSSRRPSAKATADATSKASTVRPSRPCQQSQVSAANALAAMAIQIQGRISRIAYRLSSDRDKRGCGSVSPGDRTTGHHRCSGDRRSAIGERSAPRYALTRARTVGCRTSLGALSGVICPVRSGSTT